MLKVGIDFVNFEACSSGAVDIFFDNVNQRICTVRGNGEMGVTAKSLDKSDVVSFRISDKGQLRSINFSADSQIVSIQRELGSVDFVFLSQKVSTDVQMEVKQPCKKTGSEIRGLQWFADTYIGFITDQGVELYLLNHRRKTIKFLKSILINVNWFLCYGGVINRLTRFEADFGCSPTRPKLFKNDITIASIYERISVLVLQSGKTGFKLEKINIYEFSSSDPFEAPKLTKTLRLDLCGLVGVHVIDNLIFLHHKNSCRSLVFDVGKNFNNNNNNNKLMPIDLNDKKLFRGGGASQPPSHFHTPMEFQPICITRVEIDKNLSDAFDSTNEIITLYSPTWVIFAPNIIADLKLGIFTRLELFVEPAKQLISDNNILLDFLIKRCNGEQIFLDVLKESLLKKSLPILKICELFQQILEKNRLNLNSTTTTTTTSNILTPNKDLSSNTRCQLISIPFCPFEIDHNTILRSVFDPLRSAENMDKKFLSCLVLEFFLIVKRIKIPMEHHYLPELLLNVLIDAKQFNKLQQLLQYRVIDDSKFLAFELISLGKIYPPLNQMALDMLARRENMEQIAEVLLAQGQVVEAIRCMTKQPLDRIHCLKLLQAAWRSQNRQIKYTVYSHLAIVRKLPFFDGTCEEFEKYIQEFKVLFNNDEIEEAQMRFSLARISDIGGGGGGPSSINNNESISTTLMDDSLSTQSFSPNLDEYSSSTPTTTRRKNEEIVVHEMKKDEEMPSSKNH